MFGGNGEIRLAERCNISRYIYYSVGPDNTYTNKWIIVIKIIGTEVGANLVTGSQTTESSDIVFYLYYPTCVQLLSSRMSELGGWDLKK